MAKPPNSTSPRMPGSRPPPEPPRSSLPPPGPPERVGYRGWIILGILLAGFALYKHFSGDSDTQPAIAYTSFYKELSDQKIESVMLRGQNVLGKFKGPTDVEGHK